MILSDFSDLSKVSPETRNSWIGEIAIREKYRSYYSGDIFKDTVPAEEPVGEEEPELYPVGINLVKMLTTAQADALFGEWEEDIVKFEPGQNAEVSQPEKDASDLARKILRNSNANSMLWEMALEREVYGGSPIKITPALKLSSGVKWDRIALGSFFPIWDPDDIDSLLEVYIVTEMTRDQAKAKWGIVTGDDTVRRVEHWTNTVYENTVGNVRIDAYSGINPWGFVPFVYFPRFRSDHWWGDSLTEDLIRVQDELNMRIADLGDAVNYNTHPIKWAYNLPKSFDTKNYPIGSNILWDAGKVLGSSPEPHIEILEAKNPIPSGTFDYINFLYDWGMTSSFIPPVVLGRSESASQRAGITVELKMQSLVRATRRSRSYMSTGLLRAMRMSALILSQKDLPGISKRALSVLIEGSLLPFYAPVLPRDQEKVVDEITKRLSTTPPTISLETSVKKLGDGTSEVERIRTMLKEDDLYKRDQPPKEIGMNSGAGNAPKKKTETNGE
jgi:hypothetical protein